MKLVLIFILGGGGFPDICVELEVRVAHCIILARTYILSLFLEMLWSETGYFGLLGNNYILFGILLYPIKRSRFIWLKQFIWEERIGTTVSLGRFSYP